MNRPHSRPEFDLEKSLSLFHIRCRILYATSSSDLPLRRHYGFRMLER
jgi:hypothetical protein